MRLSLHFIGDFSDESGDGGENTRSNFHGQRIILRGSRRIFVLDRQLCSELHFMNLPGNLFVIRSSFRDEGEPRVPHDVLPLREAERRRRDVTTSR